MDEPRFDGTGTEERGSISRETGVTGRSSQSDSVGLFKLDPLRIYRTNNTTAVSHDLLSRGSPRESSNLGNRLGRSYPDQRGMGSNVVVVRPPVCDDRAQVDAGPVPMLPEGLSEE
jgi:hypothetical protein